MSPSILLFSTVQSKEQLKALKAQKAAAAAQQQESTRQSPEQDTKSMPPPPPRPSSIISQRPPQVPASFHEDSQGTLLNGGGGLTAAALHSEPSVNKLPLPLYGSQNDASAVASNPLPSGFFEPQEQGSTGGGSGGGAGGGGGLAPTRSTRSAEGSTGGLEEDGRGVFNAADLATSALSAKSWGEGTAASQVTPAGVFPEESTAYAENGPVTTHNNLRAAGDVASSGPGALPKGFFEGAAAEAHQAAHRPVKDAKQMDSEFAAFMSEVEAEAAIAEAQAAQGEEEEEEGHRDRDGFEQL